MMGKSPCLFVGTICANIADKMAKLEMNKRNIFCIITITKKESGLTSVLKTEQGGEAPKPLSKNSIAPPSGESKRPDEAVKKTVRF